MRAGDPLLVGPLGAFNAFETWSMVVLIVGLNLFGYLLYQLLGSEHGILVGALAGALVSSTAVTVTAARRSKSHRERESHYATAIVLAASVVYVRVFVEIAVIDASLARAALSPLAVLFAVGVVGAAFLWRGRRRAEAEG